MLCKVTGFGSLPEALCRRFLAPRDWETREKRNRRSLERHSLGFARFEPGGPLKFAIESLMGSGAISKLSGLESESSCI